MYLIGEYLKQQKDPNYKIDLNELSKKYENLTTLNKGIIQRIRALKGGDATQNAVLTLDGFASLLPLEISSGLEEMKEFF
jgi:hypothetical protein